MGSKRKAGNPLGMVGGLMSRTVTDMEYCCSGSVAVW